MSTLLDLPDQVLRAVATCLVPAPNAFEAPAFTWQPSVNLATSARELHLVFGEILCEALPSLALAKPLPSYERTCWLRTLAALRSMQKASWCEVKTLRATRPQNLSFTPVQTAPCLSGASMCVLGDNLLVIFGGRSSISGQTLGKTYLVQLSWSRSVIAQWDEVQCKAQPAARCYHTAARWTSSRDGMIVFGGAGSGDTLFNDSWSFKQYDFTLPDGRDCTAACWEQLHQPESSEAPTARSSHVCATWTREDKLVLHGGLGNSGTMGDTWTLEKGGCWMRFVTSGAHVARAHHIGGVVNDHLIVHSGHEANLLTTNRICALHLCEAVWLEITWPNGPAPRIDAAASVVENVGLLIFGGVGADYEFESAESWMLPAIRSTRVPQKVAPRQQSTLSPRACCSMCSDGLRTYIFGGFNGSEDLSDLWCLNLVPPWFEDKASNKTQKDSLVNDVLVRAWELEHRIQGA